MNSVTHHTQPIPVASMQRSGIEGDHATALTPTLSRAAGEGAEPLTLEQRVEALELAFGRATLHATNVAMAAVGAAHKAPGAVAAPAKTMGTAHDEAIAQIDDAVEIRKLLTDIESITPNYQGGIDGHSIEQIEKRAREISVLTGMRLPALLKLLYSLTATGLPMSFLLSNTLYGIRN